MSLALALHLLVLRNAAIGVLECDENELHVYWVCALGAFEVGRV